MAYCGQIVFGGELAGVVCGDVGESPVCWGEVVFAIVIMEVDSAAAGLAIWGIPGDGSPGVVFVCVDGVEGAGAGAEGWVAEGAVGEAGEDFFCEIGGAEEGEVEGAFEGVVESGCVGGS